MNGVNGPNQSNHITALDTKLYKRVPKGVGSDLGGKSTKF